MSTDTNTDTTNTGSAGASSGIRSCQVCGAPLPARAPARRTTTGHQCVLCTRRLSGYIPAHPSGSPTDA